MTAFDSAIPEAGFDRARSGVAGSAAAAAAPVQILLGRSWAFPHSQPMPCLPSALLTLCLAAPTNPAVNDLFRFTDDPTVHKRLVAADSDRDGRISRRVNVAVLKSEVAGACLPAYLPAWLPACLPVAGIGCQCFPWLNAGLALRACCRQTWPPAAYPARLPRPALPPLLHPSPPAAKLRLRSSLMAGAALLAFCMLMLAANACLTYSVIKMSQDTRVHSNGKLTDRTGSHIVGEPPASSHPACLQACQRRFSALHCWLACLPPS
jgi:hypothetical protein